MDNSVAVVDPGQDQTTSQCLCQFHSQQVSNVLDGLCMVIARSRHRWHVFVEWQTPIEHDPQHFDIISYGQVDSGHRYRWYGWRRRMQLTDGSDDQSFWLVRVDSRPDVGRTWTKFITKQIVIFLIGDTVRNTHKKIHPNLPWGKNSYKLQRLAYHFAKSQVVAIFTDYT